MSSLRGGDESDRRNLPAWAKAVSMASVVRLVLFDIDGTLIRTGGAGVRAFERTFATEFKIDRATQHLNFAGRTDSSLVRECFHGHGIAPTAANFQRFFDTYVFWLQHLLHELNGQPCPGVHALIAAFQRALRPPLLGLLTGNIRLGAEIKLRHYGLWDAFRSGAFGDDHEDRNELAAIARDRGSRLLGTKLHGDEILVIGDTPRDIECARAVKARVLAVGTGGYSCEQLCQHQPNWLVETLESVEVADFCG
jgi:phosphoglycolate phosphatase-like HAD superfamily hydrolase